MCKHLAGLTATVFEARTTSGDGRVLIIRIWPVLAQLFDQIRIHYSAHYSNRTEYE